MKNTAGDFWRMVWEMKSMIIIMLTNTEENEEVNFQMSPLILFTSSSYYPLLSFSLLHCYYYYYYYYYYYIIYRSSQFSIGLLIQMRRRCMDPLM